ncbi:MAG: cytochrome-c peroxidase [Pseudomonadales bacterium]
MKRRSGGNARQSMQGAVSYPWVIFLLLLLVVVGFWWDRQYTLRPWSTAERALLESMRLAALPSSPLDPTNRVSGDLRAAELGHRLFFDPRLSGNGQVSCATCHQPQRGFTDGLPRSVAVGQSKRNAPSLIAVAYSPWLYWDGRKDSLWSQALSPLEDPAEHAGNRVQYVDLIGADLSYRKAYEELFGPFPELLQDAEVDKVFANLGKAIGAYERLLLPGPSRFDDYVDALLADDAERQRRSLTPQERKGLRVFLGKGNCTQCHNGPLLTNNAFHNTGVLSSPGVIPDKGRSPGLRQVRADAFNCIGRFSDAQTECAELRFAKDGPEMLGAFRTPSLRNLQDTAPYMHAGQLETLADVIAHYDTAADAMLGHNEAKPLNLWPWERRRLEAFLHSLQAPPAIADRWLQTPP